MGVFSGGRCMLPGVANFTSDDLVAYIWLQRITAAKADKLVVGVDIPAVLSEP